MTGPPDVKEDIEVLRDLLALISRRSGVAITISQQFMFSELLEALKQLEIEPAEFFRELAILKKDLEEARSMLMQGNLVTEQS